MKNRVLIVGGGVSGLTTALALAKLRIPCVIVAEDIAPNITSVVAGALWEWPPAVCGYHKDDFSLDRSKCWCMVSFAEFERLSDDPSTGVSLRLSNFYFRNKLEEHAFDLQKMREMQDVVPGFVRDPDLIKKNQVNQDIGLVDAYQHLAPMVDTDVYMKWLWERVKSRGVEVVRQRIDQPLADIESELKSRFNASIIINCAGLGARLLASEDMYPLRGALVRLVDDGSKVPKLTQAHCVSHDKVTSDKDIVFIVPRGKDRIVLGAITEANEWSKDISMDNHAPLRDVYRRCVEFLPTLGELAIDPVEPVRVGLRPFRRGNVRLEASPGTSIIHNYGHGGSGVTFSWGCAWEVATHVQHALERGGVFDRLYLSGSSQEAAPVSKPNIGQHTGIFFPETASVQ